MEKPEGLEPLHPEVLGSDENAISRQIVESAIEVHRSLGGPGLLESVYEEALLWELGERGLRVERELPVSVRSHERD